MAAISWRALAGDAVTRRRFCSASKSSRPLVLTTSSPFILSRRLGCAVLLGRERCGHVHNAVVDLVAAASRVSPHASCSTLDRGARR
jgi:hypothetical protein